MSALSSVSSTFAVAAEVYPDLGGKPVVVAERVFARREELIRLLVGGVRVKECAVMLRVNPATVRSEIRSPYFLARLRELNEKVYNEVDGELAVMKVDPVARLREMANDALDNIEELMSSENPMVKLRATQDVLDRNTDTSRTRRLQSTKKIVTIDVNKLQQAAQTSEEVKRFHEAKMVDCDQREQTVGQTVDIAQDCERSEQTVQVIPDVSSNAELVDSQTGAELPKWMVGGA